MIHTMISIIIPVYNEEKYIAKCLNSILSSILDIEITEILIVDGMSTDKTLEIIQLYINKNPFIRIIKNPDRIVPISMNLGIKNSTGEYIIRVDAHASYPKSYFSKLIEWHKKLNADNVGGVCKAISGDNSLKAKAIALSLSNSFGVGNSQFRLNQNKTVPFQVDTVPFGCYKRSVFEKIGNYDIDLIRNQDDELNGRLINNGGKIFLIPDLKIEYFVRKTLKKTFKMFYQYGYFKPLVNIKLKAPATIRQFVPLVFVLFLIIGTLGSLSYPPFLFLYLCGIFLYLIVNIFFSYIESKKNKNLALLPYMILSFFIIHFSYGIGYLKGIYNFIILKKHKRK